MTRRTRRSACSGVRTLAAVSPRCPLAIRKACSSSKRARWARHSSSGVSGPRPPCYSHIVLGGCGRRHVLDGDAQHGTAQDGRPAVPEGEVAAVAVDEGMDHSPGVDADGAVERVPGRVRDSSGLGSACREPV